MSAQTPRDGLILGVETSCDDTAAALVDAEGRVIASVVASQTEIHAEFGGVYPELASRAHVATIVPTIDKTLTSAGISGEDLRAIAVTRGPGLIGSLLVGLNTAAGLSIGWDVPVLGVNHLRGHLRSPELDGGEITYPALALLVSGGHTLLARMDASDRITVLGTTRDVSVGEAFDKVGRMLDLGYPGGPAVDRLAATGQPAIDLPRPMIRDGLDFSFSGLKTAVAHALTKGAAPADLASSFVEACFEVLMTKCRRALSQRTYRSLVIVGGVAASKPLRAQASDLCEEMGVTLNLPPLKWATDNAAMIALTGWDYLDLANPPGTLPEVRLKVSEL